MANRITSSERNMIDNAAYQLLGKPLKEAAKALNMPKQVTMDL